MPMANLVARKTITTIQSGSVYKERWVLPDEQPPGTTVRIVFLDSAGGQLAEFPGTVERYTIEFREPYASVSTVPNAAGFYVYIQKPDDVDDDNEEMVRYGSVFRRELTFPSSPAVASSTVVRQFEDSFQRPAGAVGGRWKVLVGQPRIYTNGGGVGANTVAPNYNFLSRYYMYYYQPFNSDTVELSISMIDKGNGGTIVSLCANSNASSYLYIGWNSNNDTITAGYGNGPDIGSVLVSTGNLEPQVGPVAHVVPSNALKKYVVRYDDTTHELALYNADKTTKYLSWVDSSQIVPHGKGYRYFGVGGNTGLLDSGVQMAYVKAQGTV